MTSSEQKYLMREYLEHHIFIALIEGWRIEKYCGSAVEFKKGYDSFETIITNDDLIISGDVQDIHIYKKFNSKFLFWEWLEKLLNREMPKESEIEE